MIMEMFMECFYADADYKQIDFPKDGTTILTLKSTGKIAELHTQNDANIFACGCMGRVINRYQ